jgi:hypothetical protein
MGAGLLPEIYGLRNPGCSRPGLESASRAPEPPPRHFPAGIGGWGLPGVGFAPSAEPDERAFARFFDSPWASIPSLAIRRYGTPGGVCGTISAGPHPQAESPSRASIPSLRRRIAASGSVKC